MGTLALSGRNRPDRRPPQSDALAPGLRLMLRSVLEGAVAFSFAEVPLLHRAGSGPRLARGPMRMSRRVGEGRQDARTAADDCSYFTFSRLLCIRRGTAESRRPCRRTLLRPCRWESVLGFSCACLSDVSESSAVAGPGKTVFAMR